jgi:hypothetical protein
MRKALVAGAVVASATLGSIAVADAAPPGLEKKEGEDWVCNGDDAVIFTAGRNGWIGDTHYQAIEFSFEGTFTPAGGGPVEEFSFERSWPATGGETISCTRDITETNEEGTFVSHDEVTAEAL